MDRDAFPLGAPEMYVTDLLFHLFQSLHGEIFRSEVHQPLPVIRYQDHVSLRPYLIKKDPAQKAIKDDDVISLKDLFCLVAFHPSVLVY